MLADWYLRSTVVLKQGSLVLSFVLDSILEAVILLSFESVILRNLKIMPILSSMSIVYDITVESIRHSKWRLLGFIAELFDHES